MERKSMGDFIAVLRRAKGMTQKELADKLNVSDKSVSRWERNEGAPDLSLIPVIAEIFGVSSDELLRGERKPAGEQPDDKPHPKTEKQRQRILASGLSKYRNRSMIATALAVLGLLVAMVINLGFSRAYIGFFCAAALCLAGVVMQAVCVNSAFLAVADDELSGAEVERFKRSVILTAEKSISLSLVLLCGSLPLITVVTDAYVGLSPTSWLSQGLIAGLIGLVVCSVICYFLTNSLQKRGVYRLTEKEAETYRHNFSLKRRCVLGLIIALLLTFAGHAIATGGWDAASVARGTEFNDYDSFVAFMELDLPVDYDWSSSDGLPDTSTAVGDAQYYDEYGNEITEDEALRCTLTDSKGNVVCEYIERNKSVWGIQYQENADGGILPIKVYSRSDLLMGNSRINTFNAVFAVAYLLELAAAFVFYFCKRAR